MRMFSRSLTIVAAAVLIVAVAPKPAPGADVLYIGDAGDNQVKRFDVGLVGTLDPSFSTTGLLGPNGLIIDGQRLLAVNQNVNTHLSGEILAFDKADGASLGAVIAESDHNAPYVPRGIVLGPGGTDLFVGNFSTAQGKSHGSLLRFDVGTGELLSNDPAKGFKNHDFHPRGIVFGPDGMLYVASPSSLSTGLGGAVLRFHADGTFADVFLEDDGGFGHLNRPEGIVFGPEDGNLYVTSFRAAPGDMDGVRIYDSTTGDFLRQIDYYDDPINDPRVSAQSILFGPDGKLFAPMLQSGELRAYDVTDDTFTTIVEAGTDLVNPFYMTFGQTNPSTLAYERTMADLTAVPEPSAFALAAFGMFSLLALCNACRFRTTP